MIIALARKNAHRSTRAAERTAAAHAVARRTAAVVSLGAIAMSAAPVSAATTITVAQWRTFVAGTAIGKCHPGFVPKFAPIVGRDGAKVVTISPAELKSIQYGDELERPMATKVTTTDPTWNGSTLTAERDGAYVSFLLESPGGSQRGFIEANPGSLGLASGTTPFIARLQKHVPAAVLAAAAPAACGFALLDLRGNGNEGDESDYEIILRGKTVVGVLESDGG